MEAPWRDAHNADPGRKKERILTEVAELTVTKTRRKNLTLSTFVDTSQSCQILLSNTL